MNLEPTENSIPNPAAMSEHLISHIGLEGSMGKDLEKNFGEGRIEGNPIEHLDTLHQKSLKHLDAQASSVFGLKDADRVDVHNADEMHPIHERVLDIKLNPESLADHLGNGTIGIASHAPNVTTSMANVITKGLDFLDTAKPVVNKMAPLDQDLEPAQHAVSDYNRVASLVNKPTSLFNHLKDGTIHGSDLNTVKSVYPNLYSEMQNAVMQKMTDFLSKHEVHEIPYQIRLSLSKLLGQNLDSSLSQFSLQSNQQAFLVNHGQQNMMNAGMSQKPSKTGIGKMKVDNDKTDFQDSQGRTR
jgi:hypothetical protein